MARRSGKQKLIGWGVFVTMILVIVAIFLVTRMPGEIPQAPSAANRPVAALSPSAAVSIAPSEATTAAATDTRPSVVATTPAPPAAAPSAAAVPASTTSQEPAVEVVDAATMSQPSRRSFLLTLIQQGVFTGVQALDTPPKVGVTALFKGLSPSLQQQFIAVVYAYINNGAAGTQALQLIDATSGDLVGSYTANEGLKLG